MADDTGDQYDLSPEALAQYHKLVEETTNIHFDPLARLEQFNAVWALRPDFDIYIIKPTIMTYKQPKLIAPEPLAEHADEIEFVYPILDFGSSLSTSKGEDTFLGSMSMCKFYYTIEKMISLLYDRLKAHWEEAGDDGESVTGEIAFGGHEIARRKAFESIINIKENIIVTNFEPGEWGERFIKLVKQLADKGYGYPKEAPRDFYRHPQHSTSQKPK